MCLIWLAKEEFKNYIPKRQQHQNSLEVVYLNRKLYPSSLGNQFSATQIKGIYQIQITILISNSSFETRCRARESERKEQDIANVQRAVTKQVILYEYRTNSLNIHRLSSDSNHQNSCVFF